MANAGAAAAKPAKSRAGKVDGEPAASAEDAAELEREKDLIKEVIDHRGGSNWWQY